METTETTVRSILTRTSGYLSPVASHSLQPYRGCAYGKTLCGVGCYARHNGFVTRGREWGAFLEARLNTATAYAEQYEREQRWARRQELGRFVIYCASVTDPFVPQERRYRLTRQLLKAMVARPPDGLILQTHSHRVLDELELIARLARKFPLRVHVSIESDRDRLPGLPPPASSVARRLDACAQLRAAGVRTIVTIAPLLPIEDPDEFFRRIGEVADGVILDHFLGGDGSVAGNRTLRTPLPAAMARVEPESVTLAYLERMVEAAREVLPGRVGVGQMGFAGEFS